MNKTIMNPVTIFRTRASCFNNVNGATMSIISGFALKTHMYLKINLTYRPTADFYQKKIPFPF